MHPVSNSAETLVDVWQQCVNMSLQQAPYRIYLGVVIVKARRQAEFKNQYQQVRGVLQDE